MRPLQLAHDIPFYFMLFTAAFNWAQCLRAALTKAKPTAHITLAGTMVGLVYVNAAHHWGLFHLPKFLSGTPWQVCLVIAMVCETPWLVTQALNDSKKKHPLEMVPHIPRIAGFSRGKRDTLVPR